MAMLIAQFECGRIHLLVFATIVVAFLSLKVIVPNFRGVSLIDMQLKNTWAVVESNVSLLDSQYDAKPMNRTLPQYSRARTRGNTKQAVHNQTDYAGLPSGDVSDATPSRGDSLASKAAQHSLERLQNISFGITYFGYSSNLVRVRKYINDITVSAWGLKQHNPNVSVALFTNANISVSPPFDHVIRIADEDISPPITVYRRGADWNILTRVRYHEKSPYNLTLQIDSDRTVCASLSRIFELLAGGWDLLSTSGGSLPTMDHGILGFQNRPAVHELLRAWVTRMIKRRDDGL